MPCKLTLDEWKKLAPYLAIRFLKAGDTLIREGESDRELFILAEGELQPWTIPAKTRRRPPFVTRPAKHQSIMFFEKWSTRR